MLKKLLLGTAIAVVSVGAVAGVANHISNSENFNKRTIVHLGADPAPAPHQTVDETLAVINQNPGHNWDVHMVGKYGAETHFEVDNVVRAYHGGLLDRYGIVLEQADGHKYAFWHVLSITCLK